MVRHSHEDALSESEFEALLAATSELDHPHDEETYVILLLGGRLGMRAGEIAHMRKEWIDWERQQIRIPTHEPCTKGRDGGVCGYCRAQAKQAVNYRPDELSLDEELKRRWKPKTETSARTIPFDFSDRIEPCLTEFYSTHDAYPRSRSSLNSRMTELADHVGLDADALYPHALRATAATFHSFRGLTSAPLQSLMGWSEPSTAKKYVRLSGGATAEALNDVHN